MHCNGPSWAARSITRLRTSLDYVQLASQRGGRVPETLTFTPLLQISTSR